MKLCTSCNKELSKAEFYKKSSAKDGLYPLCKSCTKEKNSSYYIEHKEQSRLNSLKWKQSNKELHCTMVAEWRKNNLHKHAAKENRRRFAKKQASPSWANKFFIEEIYHLAMLKTKMAGIEWHVDHIIPLKSDVVCGLHCEFNLQVIPAIENIKKSNRYTA